LVPKRQNPCESDWGYGSGRIGPSYRFRLRGQLNKTTPRNACSEVRKRQRGHHLRIVLAQDRFIGVCELHQAVSLLAGGRSAGRQKIDDRLVQLIVEAFHWLNACREDNSENFLGDGISPFGGDQRAREPRDGILVHELPVHQTNPRHTLGIIHLSPH